MQCYGLNTDPCVIYLFVFFSELLLLLLLLVLLVSTLSSSSSYHHHHHHHHHHHYHHHHIIIIIICKETTSTITSVKRISPPCVASSSVTMELAIKKEFLLDGDLSTCTMSLSRNDRQYKYVFMFPKINLVLDSFLGGSSQCFPTVPEHLTIIYRLRFDFKGCHANCICPYVECNYGCFQIPKQSHGIFIFRYHFIGCIITVAYKTVI